MHYIIIIISLIRTVMIVRRMFGGRLTNWDCIVGPIYAAAALFSYNCVF